MENTYDYIVIGTGAGGAAVTWKLVNAGKRVLLLEKGQRLPKDGSTMDAQTVLATSRYKNNEQWLDGSGKSIFPTEYYNVGGKTKWYGAALLRLREREFASDRDYGCQGWPITYNDLAPYYSEAEQLLDAKIFHQETQISQIIDRIRNTDPGWDYNPLPLGLASHITEDYQEASQFDGFASVKGYKADSENSFLEKIKNYSNLTILENREVTHLISKHRYQTIAGVVCKGGHRYYADNIILAAGALNSTRLFQEYIWDQGVSYRFPSYRFIGRYYKCHLNTALLAFSFKRKTDLLSKTVLLTHKEFSHSSVQPLGGKLETSIIRSELPDFFPDVVSSISGRHAYGFFLTTEDPGIFDNRVSMVNGRHLPTLDYSPERMPIATAEHQRFTRHFKRSLFKAGFLSTTRLMPVESTAHACGTLICGTHEDNSVVNHYGKIHGIDNLFVADGSIMPRSGSVNPSLTIYAWALRLADKLLLKENSIEH